MGSLFYFLVLWLIPVDGTSMHVESQQSVHTTGDTAAAMIFAGDLNLSDRFEQYVGPQLNYAFANWHTIGSYDAMMANLENPVTFSTDSLDKEFVFRMKPHYLPMIRNAGITIVNCANNHVGDFGRAGILETIKWLDSSGIRHVGAGRNSAEARQPVILSLHGKKIGILGFGGNGIHYAGQNCAGTVPCNEDIIVHDVQALKRNVDLVVVNFHWGEESSPCPNERQIQLAHRVVDAGADIIIGHHPHVLQGIEHYKNAFIAYSLGNFLFGGNSHDINSETIVIKLHITDTGWYCEPVPVKVTLWQPQRADSTASQKILALVKGRSQILNNQLALQ